ASDGRRKRPDDGQSALDAREHRQAWRRHLPGARSFQCPGPATVGITEKPELVPLDKLAQQFGFEPPREKGLNTIEVCEGILKGEVRAFVGLGGNFVRAIPEREAMEQAWRKLRLTVQVATKLNRSHLIHGEVTYLLPCLGRLEL